TDSMPLEKLEQEMDAAAAALSFERAAVLRDKLKALRWLRNQLERLPTARERHTFIYPVPGHRDRNLWYLIREGRIEAAIPAPVDVASWHAAAAAVEAGFQPKQPPVRPAPVEAAEDSLLVAGGVHTHPG